MKKKKIKVTVKNKQLNALEDLLYCITSKAEKEKNKKLAKKLWTKLVTAYDKE